MPLARTPLHHWHAAHGAIFAERDGWQVVSAYSATETAAPAGLALVDVSAFARISLRGAGVPAVAQALVPDSAALKPGGVADVSGVGVACRLSDDHLLVLSATSKPAGPCEGRAVVQTDVTSAGASFWLIGSAWEDCLCRLTSLDLHAILPPNRCAEPRWPASRRCWREPASCASHQCGILVAADVGEYVWDRLREAGKDRQITAIGLQTLDALRRQIDKLAAPKIPT